MRRQLLTILAIAALLPCVGSTQDPDAEPLPEVRRYAVEVIVFLYAENVGVGSEVFPPDDIVIDADRLADDQLSGPQDEAALTIQDPDEADEAGNVDYAGVDLRPVVMRRSELTLQDTVSRMRRLDVYEPIMHIGWVQPMLPDAIPDALPLQRFGAPPPGLEGEFTLYLGRYLHLVVDLAMEARGSTSSVPASQTFADNRRQFETTVAGKAYYRISENRIVKNGDLRYYDHPKFGVLAKITRIETADAAAALISLVR